MTDPLPKLSQLYNAYPDVLILHGITRIGAESEIPHEKTLAERIAFAIQSSNNSKLSAHSFAFSINERRHLWSGIGIILREAKIVAASIEDTGLRKENLHLASMVAEPDYQTILLSADRTQHNELVVQRAKAAGIYIYVPDERIQFTPEEIQSASLSLDLPVYFLNTRALIEARWDTTTNSFIDGNSVNIEVLLDDPKA